MALKHPGPLVPGVPHVEPVTKPSRLCTSAKSMTGIEMAVVTGFIVGLAVSVDEADLYLHWASDLLVQTKDDGDGNS